MKSYFTAIALILLIIVTNATLISCSSTQETAKKSLPVVNPPSVFSGYAMGGAYNQPPTDIEVGTTLPITPNTLTVYKVIGPTFDENYANSLANSLGINNAWPLTGGNRAAYSYTKDNQSLEVNLKGYIKVNLQDPKMTGTPPNLPSDQDCINIARNWLTLYKLYPDNVKRVDIGYGYSTSTIDSTTGLASSPTYYSKQVNFIISIGDYEGYSLGAWIQIGDQGKILKAEINVPMYQVYGIVNLISSQSALDILKEYLTSSSPKSPDDLKCLYNFRSDKLEIKSVSLKYAKDMNNYIQPIFVFEGDATYNNNNNVDRFNGEVDAVQR